MTPIEKGLSTYKQTSRNANDRHRLDRFDRDPRLRAKDSKPAPFASILQAKLKERS